MAADEGKVLRAVLTELAREGQKYVPVGISARHVHLCNADLKVLFGENAQLHHFKDLSQPGQFASQEKVRITGPKGSIDNVRVLGPVRSRTQVEISLSDAMQLGMKNVPVRLSGDLDNTPGIRIEGPNGSLDIPAGLIAAARHVHMSSDQAAAYGLHNGQVISLRSEGSRSCTLENVICRTGDGHELELHLDTDEANACALQNADLLEVIIPGETGMPAAQSNISDPDKIARRAADLMTGHAGTHLFGNRPAAVSSCSAAGTDDPIYEILDLVTEDDINRAVRSGKSCVYCDRKALITPAASDRSHQLGVEIVRAGLVPQKAGGRCPSDEEVLELVTAQDLNCAFRDDKKEIYCTADALITPAAKERIEETGIRIIRI